MKTIDLLDTQVVILKTRLVELLNQEQELFALEAAGVDNWEGIDEVEECVVMTEDDLDDVVLFEG